MATTKDYSKEYVETEQGVMPVKTALEFLRYYYQEDVLLALYAYAADNDDAYVANQIRFTRKRWLSSRRGGPVASQGNLPRSAHAADRGGSDEAPKLNYFAPTKLLSELLRGDWFGVVRSDAKYDARWTDAFVNALMASEWRDGIAADWAVSGRRNKRTQIKGYVVGLLADSGVIKGSYDSIAARVGLTDDHRVLSKYMGLGKKQPYAEWVQQYVTQNQ